MDRKINPNVTGVLFASLFGFSFLASKLTLGFIESPFQLISFRFVTAALGMQLLVQLGLVKLDLRGKKLSKLKVLVILNPIMCYGFEIFAIGQLPSSLIGVMNAFMPIIVTIVGHFYLGESASIKKWLYILLSVVGVIIVNSGQADVGGNFWAIVLISIAITSGSLYTIASRKYSSEFSSVEITYVMMWVGAVSFTLMSGLEWLIKPYDYLMVFTSWQAMIGIAYLGLGSSVVAFLLMNYTLSKIDASNVSVFMNFTTVVSIVAGVLVLKESFNGFQIIGCSLILTGVLGISRVDKRNPKLELKEE